jgi:hypothetical protein
VEDIGDINDDECGDEDIQGYFGKDV